MFSGVNGKHEFEKGALMPTLSLSIPPSLYTFSNTRLLASSSQSQIRGASPLALGNLIWPTLTCSK
jgi:hypothetical protein